MNGIASIKSRTAKKIAEETNLPLFYRNYIIPPLDAVIRWGARFRVNADVEINTSEAIARVSDKAECRRFLHENNIPVPLETENDFPVVGRRRKHSQGRGFFYCNNYEDVQYAKARGAEYFSKFYNKTDEYRVHVAGGRTLLVSIKVGDKSQLIWNKRKGFKFRHMRRSEWLNDDFLMDMVRTCKRAVELLELDFGAVDVMVGDDPEFVITEVNTSPALSPLAIQKYARFFRKKLNLPLE